MTLLQIRDHSVCRMNKELLECAFLAAFKFAQGERTPVRSLVQALNAQNQSGTLAHQPCPPSQEIPHRPHLRIIE
jgi:hypothetical protein